MDPHPRLILLQNPKDTWAGPCSAVFCLEAPSDATRTAAADVALIGPEGVSGLEGYWTAQATTLKSLKKTNPDAQLVGLAQDRHQAMILGEAGADLIVFGGFQPLEMGQLDMAQWWASLFVVPCACLIDQAASVEEFGQPGAPEFYLTLA